MGAHVLNFKAKKTKLNVISSEFLSNLNSKHTRKSYQTAIKNLSTYLRNDLPEEYPTPKYWEDVERGMIIEWKAWMQECGGRSGAPAAPKTIRQRLAAVEMYFLFLLDSDESPLDYLPCIKIKRPRDEVVSPTHALSSDQFRELLTMAEIHSKTPETHIAILTIFFRSGFRKNEVRLLKYEDYIDLGGGIKVLKALAKGDKTRIARLCDESIRAIDEYLAYLESIGRKRKKGMYLFPTPHSSHKLKTLERPWHQGNFNKLFSKYALLAGISFDVSPHSARATLITCLLDQGVDIYKVASEFKHASVSTTKEYDKKRRGNIKNSILQKVDL